MHPLWFLLHQNVFIQLLRDFFQNMVKLPVRAVVRLLYTGRSPRWR